MLNFISNQENANEGPHQIPSVATRLANIKKLDISKGCEEVG